MGANKFIFAILLICISATESRHNYDDYLRFPFGKETDKSSVENLKKLKNLKEFNFVEHSVQERKLEKSENRHDYIRYYARDPYKSGHLFGESSLSEELENIEDNSELNQYSKSNSEKLFKKDNTKSTSSIENYFKADKSDESEWDSEERDDSSFYRSSHNSESKTQSDSSESKNRNNHHKNTKGKYDSNETVENISKNKDNESVESYRHMLQDINNNIKSDHRKAIENNFAPINSYENLRVDDRNVRVSSETLEDNTNEELIKNSYDKIEKEKDWQTSATDSNSIEDEKVKSIEEIDSQEDDTLSDIINSNEFENNRPSRKNSRNYELGRAYHDFGKNSVQSENINIQNLLSELNKFLESKKNINAKNVHDNEIHKILKESIMNKWREMDIAVKLILIDSYRSIKNTLLTEIKNNPQATKRDISRLERKLLLLFHMTKKDIVKTVHITRIRFRIETSKLNLSQLQIYEVEQLYIFKLKEQIDAKIAAMKKNVAFNIQQFHQAIKPAKDYTTPIITHQTSTEIPFDPVYEGTTTQANIVVGNPSTTAPGFTIASGHVDVDVGNITPGTLIEVDNTLNSNTTDAGVGSHKVTGYRRKGKNFQQREDSSKFFNSITTKTTKYSFITTTNSPTIAMNDSDSSDQITARTTSDTTISENPSIRNLSSLSTTQTLPTSEVTPFVTSSSKQNNGITSNKSNENPSETITGITSPVSDTSNSSRSSSLSSTTNVVTDQSNSVTANNPSNQRPTVTAGGPITSENLFTNAPSLQTRLFSVTASVNNATKLYNTTVSNQPNKKTETTTERTISTSEISASSITTSLPSTSISNIEQSNLVTKKTPSDQRATATFGPTTNKNPSTDASTSIKTTSNSEKTPNGKTTKQINIIASNHPGEKSAGTTVEITSHPSEIFSRSTSTNSSLISIMSTKQHPSNYEYQATSTHNPSNQKTRETTTSSRLNENRPTNESSTTQTLPNSKVTPSVPISTNKQNNATTRNKFDENITENVVEITSLVTETSSSSESSRHPFTTNANTETSSLITANDPSDQTSAGAASDPTISENSSAYTSFTTQTSLNTEVTPSVLSSSELNNVTVSNQPDEKTSETTAKITSIDTEIITSPTTTRRPFTTSTNLTEQTKIVTTNSPTKTSITTRTPLNTEVTPSVISSSKLNNVTISNQPDEKTSETITKITSVATEITTRPSTRRHPFTTSTNLTEQTKRVTTDSPTKTPFTTQTSLNTEVTPSVLSSSELNNVTVSNQPDEKTSETTAKITSIDTEIITSPTTTRRPFTTSTNLTEQTKIVTTNSPTKSSITTRSPLNTQVTPSVISLSKLNNVTISNQPDEKTPETTTKITSVATEITTNPTISRVPSTADTNLTHQTNIVTTYSTTKSSFTTQTSQNTEVTPSVISSSKLNDITISNQPDEKTSETTTKITSVATEITTSPTSTRLPSTADTNLIQQTNIVTTNGPTKPSSSMTDISIDSTAKTTNDLGKTSQNVYECVDDNGLMIDCESVIISSTTTAANGDLPKDQMSQTWPGIPQECLPLFLAPNGEILNSVTTENHTITDPQTLNLCLIIAKTIVQLNHPKSYKSATA